MLVRECICSRAEDGDGAVLVIRVYLHTGTGMEGVDEQGECAHRVGVCEWACCRVYLHTGMRMERCWWGGVSAPGDGVGGCGCCRVYLHAGMRTGGVGDRVYLLPGMGVGDGGVLVRRVYLHRRIGLDGC